MVSFAPSWTPVDVYLSISALGFMYVSNRHTLTIVFGRDLMQPTRVRPGAWPASPTPSSARLPPVCLGPEDD